MTLSSPLLSGSWMLRQPSHPPEVSMGWVSKWVRQSVSRSWQWIWSNVNYSRVFGVNDAIQASSFRLSGNQYNIKQKLQRDPCPRDELCDYYMEKLFIIAINQSINFRDNSPTQSWKVSLIMAGLAFPRAFFPLAITRSTSSWDKQFKPTSNKMFKTSLSCRSEITLNEHRCHADPSQEAGEGGITHVGSSPADRRLIPGDDINLLLSWWQVWDDN